MPEKNPNQPSPVAQPLQQPQEERPIWRLLPLLDAPGAVQMAIDQWLLEQHRHHDHPPTLRFYTWNPPAISLGVSQRKNIPDHWHQLTWRGQPVDLVQRPSGGRGVLHQGDLTYAVVTSHLPGNLDQVYRTLCQFLIVGWNSLGVDLQFGQPDRRYLRSQNCFGLATNADLVDARGHKFIGSAQLKQGKYVLQHGSMVLNPDPALFRQVFQAEPPAPVFSRGTRVADRPLSEVVNRLTIAAEACFQCCFLPQPLSPEEWQAITARATQAKS